LKPGPGYWQRAVDFLDDGLWRMDAAAGGPGRRLRKLLQFVVMTLEGFVRDRLLLRASGLSYFSVLSLVPLLTVVISIVGSLGVGIDFAEMVVSQVAAGSPEAQARILALVREANLTGLGTLGAATLFLTTVLGIGNVESALNAIWGVRQERTLARRFADYLAVLVVAPLLLASALSLATTLQSQWLVQKLFEYRLFSLLSDLGLRQAPTVVLALGFAFLYWFLPNTTVRPFAAMLGGALAAVGVVTAQRLYLGLNVGVLRYDALFGGVAALPLLFVWIYVFWAIVLFGAEIAFAYDNLPRYRREVKGRPASPAEREAIGLRIALEVARAFRDGGPVWTADALAEALDAPVRSVRDVLAQLEGAGVVAARGAVEKEGGYQLGRSAERVLVTDVLRALRGERESALGDARVGALVASLLDELDASAEKGAGERTLADLVAGLSPREAG
jgi:membrane protein